MLVEVMAIFADLFAPDQRPSLFKHFIDEVKDQIKGGPPRR